MKNLVLILLLFGAQKNTQYDQTIKLKYKIIKNKDLSNFIAENNCELLVNKEGDYINYYGCDNNMLVVENCKAKQIAVYYNRDQYFKIKEDTIAKSQFNPLRSKQKEIMSLPESEKKFICELSDSLKITLAEPFSNINLKTVNNAIKKYGYIKAIQNLYINIIIFAGEYVRAHKGGHWIIQKSKQYPNDYEPIFIDETGKDYSFWFNHSILKDFNTRDSFNLERLIKYSLAPNVIN